MLISGHLLIDGTGNPPIENGAVLIENGIIVAVDEKYKLENLVRKEDIIFYPESVLIPGLIDSHNHLSIDPNLDNYLSRMDDRESELTIRACYTMKTDLYSGVTTSRCMGDRFFLDVACKKAVEEHRIPGPRLLVATRGIRATHAHGFVGLPFDGPDMIRLAVRENIKAGADLIKFYLTGTVRKGEKIPYYLSEEEIKTIVYEAKSNGLKTAVHCIGGKGLELCIESGVDIIEHGYYLTDYEISLLENTSTWLVLTPGEFFEDKENLSPDKNEAFRKDRAEVKERLKAIINSKIKYAVGTDGAHGCLAKELKHLVDAGATEMDALKAATLNGAKVCGIEDKAGTLEVGKYADIVAIKGNPLDDITNLAQVKIVIKQGNILFQG
ncbi:MAG: hypothetical protein JM58_01290 [Peptococcaceae bacterium BICA1-8]|nr:MAG: hypothetical protein JM58_01290 [Peptococcaceae bacterium BICA1-8]